VGLTVSEEPRIPPDKDLSVNSGLSRRPPSVSRVPRHGDEESFSLAFILRAIAHWWTVAAPVALLLATGSVVAVWVLVKPKYRATAWIQIEDTTPYVVAPTPIESRRFVQTQIELMRSPLVIGPVLANSEVQSIPELQAAGWNDPVSRLGKRLQVEPVGDSELYEVSFDSVSPAHAATVVNAVVDEYFKMWSESNTTRSQRVIELLEQEKERRGREVQRLQALIRELGKEIAVKNHLPVEPGVMVVNEHPLQKLRDRLSATEVERHVLEAQVRAYKESPTNEEAKVPLALVERDVDLAPSVVEARARLNAKQAQLPRLLAVAARGKDDPQYKQALEEVNTLQQNYERARDEVRPAIADMLQNRARSEGSKSLAQMEVQLEGLVATEALLRGQIKEEADTLEDTGSQAVELEFTRNALAHELKVYDQIAQRALTMRTEARAPARVTLLKEAVAPSSPIERFPVMPLGLAAAFSLCLPFGLAILREAVVRRIANTKELEQHAPAPVVAEVVRLPSRRHSPRTRMGEHMLGLYEESIDALRTGIWLSDGHVLSMVAVASAVSGEGKTSTATQLALSLARASGEPTLLVDADLRSPDIHRVFGIDHVPGLVSVLRGDCQLEDAICDGWGDGLHLLPSGRLTGSPHRLIGDGRLEQCWRQLRQRYRFIVVDTPPLLAASEALEIARQADGVLLCAMRDRSRAKQVQAAYRRLLSTGAVPIGAVLNGVSLHRYARAYGSYPYSKR